MPPIFRYFLLLLVFIPMMTIGETNPGEYTIGNTRTHQITSSVNKKEYELYVHLPRAYAGKEKHFPLVLVNDSEFSFPLAAGMVKLLMGNDMREVILVSISYSKGDNAGVSRTRDYTPTFAPDETSFHSVEAKQGSGRAKDYIAFIEKDIFPFLEENYRIDTNNQVFVGHSFGGLLGAYTLLIKPTLFDHYIIGSPSLWYDNQVMFELEKTYANSHKKMPANVLMYVGEHEDGNIHTMVKDLFAYEKQLLSRNYDGLALSVNIVAGGTHHTTFPLLLAQALPQILPVK